MHSLGKVGSKVCKSFRKYSSYIILFFCINIISREYTHSTQNRGKKKLSRKAHNALRINFLSLTPFLNSMAHTQNLTKKKNSLDEMVLSIDVLCQLLSAFYQAKPPAALY
jgi:hypothetical protein